MSEPMPEESFTDNESGSDTDTNEDSLGSASQGMTREVFTQAYGRDSADYADAVIAGRRGDYVPATGFQATRERNVGSIMRSGLDPDYGGTGAAAAAAADPNFAGANFQEGSRDAVHYTPNLETAHFYQGYLEERPPRGDATVLGVNLEGTGHTEANLRMEALDLAGYERVGAHTDPDDPREAFRTTELIPPENIATELNVDNPHRPPPDDAYDADDEWSASESDDESSAAESDDESSASESMDPAPKRKFGTEADDDLEPSDEPDTKKRRVTEPPYQDGLGSTMETPELGSTMETPELGSTMETPELGTQTDLGTPEMAE